MIRSLTLLALCVIFVAAAQVGATERLLPGYSPIHHGGPVGGPGKALPDTFMLMGPAGSGAPYIGNFESQAKALDPGGPLTHGWTSVDETARTESHWHVSTYFAVNGTYSALCGDPSIPSCGGDPLDPAGGYGNNWNELLEYRATVTDPLGSTNLTIVALANIHSEPGYDGTTLQAEKAGTGFVDLAYWEGQQPGLSISESVTYLAGEYMGAAGDEIVLVWRFTSDGGWSDEDCSFPSTGGIQLDDVSVASDNGGGTAGTVTFEDGTLGPFEIRLPQGVGDFAHIRSHLGDIDQCVDNWSNQVVFVDDGEVVAGTGGTFCQNWCYGPEGYIVNTTGGLAGPDQHLHNAIISPPMAWADPNHAGALFTYGVYAHEDLSADAPGIYYDWHVRSTNTGDPADLEEAPWENRDFLQLGSATYERQSRQVDDLLAPGTTHVQVRLAAYELGWVWGWNGNDGYPSPYFDNVRFETYPVLGPAFSVREIELANDGFPENGTLDLGDPGSLWVRFDMARNIRPSYEMGLDPGDSVVFDCAAVRRDAVLEGLPELVYRVRTNPVFDSYRTDPTPYVGAVPCPEAVSPAGSIIRDRFYGDLPDTAWLFPGDVVHYYFRATDRDMVTGELRTSVLPADTTGFSDFEDPLGYAVSFTMRALPGIVDLAGSQPPILFWNDHGNRGGRERWYSALANNGYFVGRDLDVYYTNAASSGVGNGLGARATAAQMVGYDVLLYTCGDMTFRTLSNGDFNGDAGEDIQLLTSWLDSGGRKAFMTGDNLVADLLGSGAAGADFVNDFMKVVWSDMDIRPIIGGQAAPLVRTEAGNPVLFTVGSWIAYGGCPYPAIFDAVEPAAGAQRLAYFTDPSLGGGDSYPYSAATLAEGLGVAGTSTVISLPYGFMDIRTDPREDLPGQQLAARARALGEVLRYFGFTGPFDVAGQTLAPVPLSIRRYPNPFNPQVHIACAVGRPGRLQVRVFDMRGRLVSTLLDEAVAGDADVVWNGRDAHGADMASGIYFYEVRLHGEVQLGKMTLVR